MTNIYIKNDERSKKVSDVLQTYIRRSTPYNLSIKEENADFCIKLFIPEYPAEERFNSFIYNNAEGMEYLANSIYQKCFLYEIKTRPLSKKTMSKDEYEASFKCTTLSINLTNDSKKIDEELYALVIGQGIVSYLNPEAVLETLLVKDKNSIDKSYVDKKYVKEPTSNAKLLFKK
jgi:hypothetical protein